MPLHSCILLPPSPSLSYTPAQSLSLSLSPMQTVLHPPFRFALSPASRPLHHVLVFLASPLQHVSYLLHVFTSHSCVALPYFFPFHLLLLITFLLFSFQPSFIFSLRMFLSFPPVPVSLSFPCIVSYLPFCFLSLSSEILGSVSPWFVK